MAQPDLYIKWRSTTDPQTGCVADVGARPLNPCWPPCAIWTNESIWMETAGNDPITNLPVTRVEARLNEPTRIKVNAYSEGASYPDQPAGNGRVTVQIWVCRPATNPQQAATFPFYSSVPTDRQIRAPATFGTATSIVWVPNFTGHACIMANCYWQRDPASSPTDPLNENAALNPNSPSLQLCGNPVTSPDPTTAPFDPFGGHHGQRNISIVQSSEIISYAFDVWGGPEEEMFDLEVRERRGLNILGRAEREALLALESVEAVGGRPRRPKVRRPQQWEIEELGFKPTDWITAEPVERARLANGGRLVFADDPRVRIRSTRRPAREFALESGEETGRRIQVQPPRGKPAEVALHIQPERRDPPGTTRVFVIAQRTATGELAGGITLITVKG